jgi:hypothetical protein
MGIPFDPPWARGTLKSRSVRLPISAAEHNGVQIATAFANDLRRSKRGNFDPVPLTYLFLLGQKASKRTLKLRNGFSSV